MKNLIEPNIGVVYDVFIVTASDLNLMFPVLSEGMETLDFGAGQDLLAVYYLHCFWGSFKNAFG